MPYKADPINGRPIPVFLYYAIPSVVGLLAMSSASVVDAMFMGNFVGTTALAAVNLTMPATSLLFAMSFMLAMGGSVIVGKLLGEGQADAAADVFSKVILLAFSIASVVAIPGVVFIDQLAGLLGANEEAHPQVVIYLRVILIAAPLTTIAYALYYFVMVDGRPVLASSSLVAASMINIALNWLFIVELEFGIFGAALASALSHLALCLILLPHLFSEQANIRLQKPKGSWRPIKRAAFNGVSEFTNELSVGVVTLMFNWTLISRFGTEGVAAFTVVEYVMFIGVMISYGFADAIQPLISKNLGAQQSARIYGFFRIGLVSTLLVSLMMSAFLLLAPELLIGAFLQDEAHTTMEIALRFAAYFWPAPILIGANIILTVFFTATNQPVPSAIIAVCRGLLFPAAFLLVLPKFLGDTGIFITVPVAELVAFLVAIYLLRTLPSVRFDARNQLSD